MKIHSEEKLTKSSLATFAISYGSVPVVLPNIRCPTQKRKLILVTNVKDHLAILMSSRSTCGSTLERQSKTKSSNVRFVLLGGRVQVIFLNNIVNIQAHKQVVSKSILFEGTLEKGPINAASARFQQ